jgi:RHS repeat-associated protein
MQKEKADMKRKELVERRSANTKVFENQDHSITAQIYLDPVHYEDGDGSWKDMDDTLAEEDPEDASEGSRKDHVNKKGKLKIRFKDKAKEKGTVSVAKDGLRLEWGLAGAAKAEAVKSGEKVLRYADVLPHTDMLCRVSGEHIKEDLVLTAPGHPENFTYVYSLKGLEAVQKEKDIAFLDAEGREVFLLNAPYMADASGEKSEAVALKLLEGKKNQCRVLLTPDAGWLSDEQRVYPVTIDPVTTTSKSSADIYDAHIDSVLEEDNFRSSILLKTWGGDDIQRSFVKFTLPDIQAGDIVVNARLVLVSLAEDKAERTVAVHRVLQPWDDSTINWNNAPLYEDAVQDLCKFTGDEQKYVTLDITRMVKDWYQNGNNFGLMFKEDRELARYTEFLSSDCHDDFKDMRPRIDISYVNCSGLEDYWSYHSQSVGRAGTVHVNDYNGNLVLEHPTLSLGGSRMPLRLSHVYNTNDCNTNIGYGYGYRLSYHQTMKKVDIAGTDYYQHVEGDGTVHYFYYDPDKKEWKDESTQELTLAINPGSADAFIIKDKEDNQRIFNSAGLLVQEKDRNGNTLSITYEEDRIISITDGAKRVTTLTYNTSGGKRTNLKQVVAPSGQVKSFGYTGDTLTSITDTDGEKVYYEYDGNKRLTKVQNIDGYKMLYTYYGTGARRVKTITEYGGSSEGDSLALAYGYNSTKFTDSRGRSIIYRFNNSGNLLHMHDSFGHAASAKYNRDGNHVNRLETETKLQTNIVQLLKDPVIQAGNSAWKGNVTTAGTVSATVNTDAACCKIGTRSLKLASTSVEGYGYWKQDATLKKGTTYMFSMYVRADIDAIDEATSGGEVKGKCFLRAQYYDGNGVQVQKDSEYIRRKTDGFIQLTTFFTLPADATSDTVNLYLHLYHVKGTLYGDMAQLETGNTANRCNLVDNGSFHLGNISGFTKTGTEDDFLTTAGTDVDVPVQRAMLVTVSGAVMRQSPDPSAGTAAALTPGQHICGTGQVTGTDGKDWFYAADASGHQGYVCCDHAIPYVGGSAGVYNGAAAKGNAILYSSASTSASRVQEGIPKGTRLVLYNTSTDTNGKKWWRAGLSIDKKRYSGYLPEEMVLRLARNAAKGSVKAAAGLYSAPSKSASVQRTAAAGESFNLRGIVYTTEGNFYAVLNGKEFVFIHKDDLDITTDVNVIRIGKTKAPGQIGELDAHIFKFTGDPEKDKKLTKELDMTGKAGDTFMVNAWGMGASLPETDNDKARRFGVEAVFECTDGTTDIHYTNFSPDLLDWQFLSDVYVAKKDYTKIRVSYTYCHNANTAFFDGLSLFREEFGQTYTYDKDNNIISVVDSQKQASKFEYSSSQDMTKLTDAKGNNFSYEYDGKHNVKKGTSAQNVVCCMDYDSAGNITKSGCVDPSNNAVGTWVARTFTSDQNHVGSVTDAGGNTVRYTWDLPKDLMTALTDAKGNVTSYAYDSSDRLKSVSMKVGSGGTETAENTYGYTKDKLTSIGHNGFSYGFAYDSYGNTKSTSIAGTAVISYEYEAKNGNLLKAVYGNGDYIRYQYDSQDRLSITYRHNAGTAEGTEEKLYSYVYNKQGELARVTVHPLAKTYFLYYDFLGRLMRVADNSGCCYEYAYDANNNMTSMRYAAEAVFQTSYAYDKDSRETEVTAYGHTRTTHYDKFGRVTERNWNQDTDTQHKTIYRYAEDGDNRSSQISRIMVGGKSTYYEYDANGNITSIKDEKGTSRFSYDRRNQLIREDSHLQGKTFAYGYDLGGNLVRVREYAYTTADTLPSSPDKTITGTFSSTWKDQLLTWDGVSMDYDTVGNMTKKGSTTYTWTEGRKLSAVNNGTSIQYTYDHTGMRARKTVGGVTTDFRMAGSLLTSQKKGTQVTYFAYDSAGNLIGMSAGSERYYYVRNAQNDITGLIDESGTLVVQYEYDSWGKPLAITGSKAGSIGERNPFRYRGYYYDDETGMYYLQSRYYDPEIRRFINADDVDVLKAQDDLYDKNLYAYCDNNPVIRKDKYGNLWTELAIGAIAGAAIGGLVSIVSQVYLTGTIDAKTLINDTVASALSGALAVTGIGKFGQIIGNGAIGAGNYIVSEGDNATGPGLMYSAFVGGIGGFVGGPGLNLEKQMGIRNYSKSVIKKFNSPKKIAMYTAKKVGVKKCILGSAKQFVKSAAVTTVANNAKERVRKVLSCICKEAIR